MKKRAIQIVPSRLRGMEMVTADTDFSFGRHTHDQFGIGLMDRGAQKSLSGRGRVESSAGDIITVNPGEVHDGSPLAGARAWRMIYCHPERLNQCFADISEGRFTSGEFSRPVFSNHQLAACFNRLFCAVTQSDALALSQSNSPSTNGALVRYAVVANALNPKLSIFFLAFLPQFITVGDAHPARTMLILSAVFAVMTFVIFSLYGAFAARVRHRILGNARVMHWIRWSVSLAFIGLAIKLALTSH